MRAEGGKEERGGGPRLGQRESGTEVVCEFERRRIGVAGGVGRDKRKRRGSVGRNGEQTRWNGSVGLTPDLWRGVDELLLEALALGQAAVVDLLTGGRWSC